MARALLEGIWSLGLDTGHPPHLHRLLERAGLAIPNLKEVLQQSAPDADAGREWELLDLPALPALRLNTRIPLTICGPGRAWAIDMALADSLKQHATGQAHWARLWPGLA